MAAGHYNYLDHLIEPGTELAASSQKFVAALILAGGLLWLGKALTSRLQTAQGLESSLVPEKKASVFGFFDLFVEVFVKYHDSVLGKEHRRHIPFVATCFLFIFLANLIGLIPGMPAITTTVWVNVGMALVVFVYFNWMGIKENGLGGHLKHFLGPVWWLAWFMLPLELLSVSLRVFTLNLRLYWNITADHIVLSTFTDILPPVAAFPFYFVGTFVSFMQAFVFTTLTMIYILLSVQHQEH